MPDQDKRRDVLRRAKARVRALRDNVPRKYEVEKAWVDEYHDAIASLEKELEIALPEFRVREDALYRSVASSNYMSGEVNYRHGLWCHSARLLQKVDALLNYLDDLFGDTARA